MTLVTLEVEGAAVVVDPDAGGRLASLVAGGRERLLQVPAPSALSPSLTYGSYLLAPFGGRICDGRVEWGGVTANLERNGGAHAIHGTVFDEPWQVAEVSPTDVTLTHTLNPARWPFRGRLRQRYALEAAGLAVEAELTAEDAMPAALGWHPWFAADGDVCIEVQADRVLRLRDDLIPTGELEPVGPATDLRGGRRTGDVHLDHVYADVRSPLAVRWPDLDLRIELGDTLRTAVVFTDVASVCVEPATAWPDSIRLAAQGCTGTGLANLRPGETLVARTFWRWGTDGGFDAR